MKDRYIIDAEIDYVTINNNQNTFYILEYYNGIKEEVNIEENILLLWQDEENNKELWYLIKPKKHTLIKYLSNQIGILTLAKSSDIYLVERYFDNYNIINYDEKNNKIDNIDINKDIHLGFNVLEINELFNNYTFMDYKNIDDLGSNQNIVTDITIVAPVIYSIKDIEYNIFEDDNPLIRAA